MPRRIGHSLPRVLLVYLAGILAGLQVALYLYDYYDGVADIRSALIGAAMIAAGAALAVWPFVRRRPGRGQGAPGRASRSGRSGGRRQGSRGTAAQWKRGMRAWAGHGSGRGSRPSE